MQTASITVKTKNKTRKQIRRVKNVANAVYCSCGRIAYSYKDGFRCYMCGYMQVDVADQD